MPERPGPPPPVTIITADAHGNLVSSTNPSALPRVRATPDAMSNPTEAARLLSDVQDVIARVGSQQQSDPHSGRIIFRDVTLAAATQLVLTHRLGRAFAGWCWNRPRVNAPTITENAATAQFPADKYLLLISTVNTKVDVEIW